MELGNQDHSNATPASPAGQLTEVRGNQIIGFCSSSWPTRIVVNCYINHHLQTVGGGVGHRPLVTSGITELIAIGSSEVVKDGRTARA